MNIGDITIPFSNVNSFLFNAQTTPERRVQYFKKKYGSLLNIPADPASHTSQSIVKNTVETTTTQLNALTLRPAEALIRSKMKDPKANYSVNLFISSTFKDMAAERDQLIKRVLPKMSSFCAENGILFNYVDLRWGITSADTELGKTIGLCLESVDSCRCVAHATQKLKFD